MTDKFAELLDVYVVSDMALLKDVVDLLFEDVPPLLIGGVCGAVLLVSVAAAADRANTTSRSLVVHTFHVLPTLYDIFSWRPSPFGAY